MMIQPKWNFIRKRRAARILAVVVAGIVVFSFLTPVFSKYEVTSLHTNPSEAFHGPSGEYWFGTDQLGRDYWCQVWYAARVSIILSAAAAVGQAVLGTLLGLLWGYVARMNSVLTGIYNVAGNIPLIIVFTVCTMYFGHGFMEMLVSLIVFGWMGMARDVRNMTVILRNREYVLASRCIGASTPRILFRDILPGLKNIILLRMALSVPGIIALESTLSFLGFGLDVNTPSLGVLIGATRNYYLSFPYLMIFPAGIVLLYAGSLYLISDLLADEQPNLQ